MSALKKRFFEGWYFKQVKSDISIAFIPAYHIDNNGVFSSSLQIISNKSSYNVNNIELERMNGPLSINTCYGHFGLFGIEFSLKNKDIYINCNLKFSSHIFLPKDIMGPFKYIPLMQCKHSVISLYHKVNGTIRINDKEYNFDNSCGYIESDRGRSFPRKYLWTQHIWEDNKPCSVMVSVADIPFLMTYFQGCICSILYKGKKIILATYKGAKIIKFKENIVEIVQGNMLLCCECIDKSFHNLKAPIKGEMINTTNQSIRSTIHYKFYIDRDKVFDFTTDSASFEYFERERG